MSSKADKLTPPLARRMGQALMQSLAQSTAQSTAPSPASRAEADDAGGQDAATLIAPAASPTAPALLAARHPGGAAAQRQARALYLRCLAYYREQARGGQPQDDVGHAAAWFVCANLAALHGQPVGSAQVAAVARQLRRLIGGHPGWQAASLAERQSLFEQLATLGVLVGETQAQAHAVGPTQGPAAIANVQRAARGYLQQLLGIDADALQLSAEGLGARMPVQA